MQTEAVIFDCDGTLVDSEQLGNEVLVSYLSEFGLEMSIENALERYRGGKMSENLLDMESLLGRKLPDEFVSEFRRRSADAMRDRLQPITGSHELLNHLKLPVAVASNAPREKIELALEVTGLSSFFGDQVFSAYEIGSWKPEPELFLRAAESLGIHPEKCVAVEDSLHGIQAGIAAGMRVFAYDFTGELEAIDGVVFIRDLRELMELI